MSNKKIIQKYPANKGSYLLFIIIAFVLPLLYIWILSFNLRELIPLSLISFVPFLFLSWIYATTSYCIAGQKVYYRSAFVKGEFDIKDITRIEWVGRPKDGVRPALASTGLGIYYGDNQRVFIAPLQPKRFLKTVLDVNTQIEVIRKQRTSEY